MKATIIEPTIPPPGQMPSIPKTQPPTIPPMMPRTMSTNTPYGIPLYDILEEREFEVYLVNARHTKNLPGRKSDVQESQWLLKLHTYGLLNNSFQPPSKIRVLRTYWRHPRREWWLSGRLRLPAIRHSQTPFRRRLCYKLPHTPWYKNSIR